MMKKLGLAVSVAIGMLSQNDVSADQITYGISDVFGGSPPVSTSIPWISASFKSTGSGTVRLSITNLNLTGAENVDEILFNLNTSLNPTSLKYTLIDTSGGFNTPKFAAGLNQFKAGGDGKYDIKLTFAQGGGMQSRFTNGEFLIADFGVAGLTASDFAFTSSPVGGSIPYYAAAHVQRIGGTSLSGWLCTDQVQTISVPEPGTGALLVLGSCLSLVGRRFPGRRVHLTGRPHFDP